MRLVIKAHIKDKKEALTLLFGDFNTVKAKEDRWSYQTGRWTGDRNAGEETHWANNVERVHGLYEIAQDAPTFDGALARSRLDRVYTNQHHSGQIDRITGAVVLNLMKVASDHRAIAFARRAPHPDKLKAPSAAAFNHKDWPVRVAAALRQKTRELYGKDGKSACDTQAPEGKHDRGGFPDR